MKRIASLILAISIIVLGSGCMGSMKALTKDQAIVRAEIGTPWGVQKVLRIGGTTNSVEIKPDGTVLINPK